MASEREPQAATGREWIGIIRSLLIYYCIPGRAARLRRFYSQFVPAGSLCLDIGAHVGNRTRAWRALGARVVMVEPQTSCVRVLERIFNKDQQVWIEPIALGASAGQARLFADPRNPTVSTLSEEWIAQVSQDPGFDKVRWKPAHLVTVSTLQALIDRYGEPAFTKIDVEGFEAEILRGLHTPLTCLSFEYLPASRQTGLDCINCLAALGHYEYNRSAGEQHRLVADDWCDADSIRDFLTRLQPGDSSGDIYARLKRTTAAQQLQQGR